jgi:hypothetical protein
MWLSASVTPAEAKFEKALMNDQRKGLIVGTTLNRLKPTLWLDRQRKTEVKPTKPPIIAHDSETWGANCKATQLPTIMPARNPNSGAR